MKTITGEATGTVRWILRLEGLCMLIGALLIYTKLNFSWGMFALFFLTPDISLLAYLSGSRAGALAYNTAHSYIGAIICLVVGYLIPTPTLLGVGIIWCAHIGFDRILGYGLKYSTGFNFTHLGTTGRFSKSAPQVTRPLG